MKNILCLSIIMILTFACRNDKKITDSENDSFGEIKKLEWLIGSWTNFTEESKSYEKWTRENDSTLTSYSYTKVENDTVFVEVVTIRENLSGLFFTVEVPNQNNAEAVTFKMISSENGVFIFENKEHDFPNRITYSNPQKDSIHAWIEGIVKGESRKVDFGFVREK